MTIVRERNLAGPCIPLGRLEKETASFYCYFDEKPWEKRMKRVAKQKAHIEPCRCCEDHPQTGPCPRAQVFSTCPPLNLVTR